MLNARRLVIALAGALALLCPGCATTYPSPDAENYRAVLLAAVTHIESRLARRPSATASTPLTLVVSSATPEPLRQACTAIRRTVRDYDLPDTDTHSLPSQHLQPLSLAITGDTAVFKGVLGPVPLPGTRASRLECGTTYQLQLLRQTDASWRIVGGSDQLCGLLPLPAPNDSAA